MELTGGQPLRPLRAGAVLSTGGQVVVAVSGALAMVVVARLLGPDGAGAYAIAISLTMLLVTLGSAGLDAGITYYVGSGRWAPWPAFVRAQLAAAVLGAAAAALGLTARLVAPAAFEGLSIGLVLVVVAGTPFALSWLFSSNVAVGLSRYELYVALPVTQSTGMLAAVAALCALDGLRGAIVGLTASQVAAATLGVVWALRALPSRAGAAREDLGLRTALVYGSRTYPANLLQFLNFRLDLFLLNALATTADVGRYSVAVSVTSVMWLLPRALSAVVFPRVAHLSAGEAEPDRVHRDMVEEKSVRHVVLITIVMALLVAGGLVGLVTLVYGAAFQDAIGLGLILLPGVSLLAIGNVLFATILGRGRPGYSLWSALIATPLTIGLYVLLIPSLEATGAALASTLSYTLSFLLAAYFYRRATGRPVLPLLVPTGDDLRDYVRALADIRSRLRSGSLNASDPPTTSSTDPSPQGGEGRAPTGTEPPRA